MWTEIKFRINFLNYGLLEHVVEILNNEKLRVSMQKYKHKADPFLEQTKLCSFLDEWPSAKVKKTPIDVFNRYITVKLSNIIII